MKLAYHLACFGLVLATVGASQLWPSFPWNVAFWAGWLCGGAALTVYQKIEARSIVAEEREVKP